MKVRLAWRVTSRTSERSECGCYSVSVALSRHPGDKLIVTAWDLTTRPAEALASWMTLNRDRGMGSAKWFCQQHADAEAEAKTGGDEHGTI